MLCFKDHERQLEALRTELGKISLAHAVLTERNCNLSTLVIRLDQQVKDLNAENRSLLDRVFYLANANPPAPQVEAPEPKTEAAPEPARSSAASQRTWLAEAQRESARLDEKFEQHVTLAVIKEKEYAST